jgi:predicted NACHT family NTPase
MESKYFLPLTFKNGKYRTVDYFQFDDLVAADNKDLTEEIKNKFVKEKTTVEIFDSSHTIDIYYSPLQKTSAYCLVDSELNPLNQAQLPKDEILQRIDKNIEYHCYVSDGMFPDQKVSTLHHYIIPRVRRIRSKDDVEYFLDSQHLKTCILFGAAGMGKTTALKKIALDISRDMVESNLTNCKIPLYIQLRNINDYLTFDDFVGSHIESMTTIRLSNFYDEIVSNGRAVFLFDGVDELYPEKQKEFTRWIKYFKSKNGNNQIILTSRPNKNLDDLDDFEKIELLPFNWSQISEYTYRKLNNNYWERFLNASKSSDTFEDLLGNPLLLGMAHHLFLRKQLFPINAAQLVKEFVDTLVERWDASKGINRYSEDVNTSKVKNDLGRLAVSCITNQKVHFTINDAWSWLSKPDISETRHYIELLTEITGLLHKVDEGKWSFNHKTFEEYLAAQYIIESAESINSEYLSADKWNNTLQYILGLNSNPTFLDKQLGIYKSGNNLLRSQLNLLLQSLFVEENQVEHIIDALVKYFIDKEFTGDIKTFEESTDWLRMQFCQNSRDSVLFAKELLDVFYKTRWTNYYKKITAQLAKHNYPIICSLKTIYSRDRHIKISIEDNILSLNSYEIRNNINTFLKDTCKE